MFNNVRNTQFYGGEYTSVGRDLYQINQTVNNYHRQQPSGSDKEALKSEGGTAVNQNNHLR